MNIDAKESRIKSRVTWKDAQESCRIFNEFDDKIQSAFSLPTLPMLVYRENVGGRLCFGTSDSQKFCDTQSYRPHAADASHHGYRREQSRWHMSRAGCNEILPIAAWQFHQNDRRFWIWSWRNDRTFWFCPLPSSQIDGHWPSWHPNNPMTPPTEVVFHSGLG